MSLKYNNKPINKVLFNGKPINKVKIDGVLVFEDIVYYTVDYYINGLFYTSRSVQSGTDAPILTVDSTRFGGWETSLANVTSNREVYGYEYYTVTFNLNGGNLLSGSINQSVRYGSNAISPTISRTGYDFVSWSGALSNITSDRTITANWNVKPPSISSSINATTVKFTITNNGPIGTLLYRWTNALTSSTNPSGNWTTVGNTPINGQVVVNTYFMAGMSYWSYTQIEAYIAPNEGSSSTITRLSSGKLWFPSDTNTSTPR